MISFQHPRFAWLFLLLFFLIGGYRSKPVFQSVHVPSIDIWSFKRSIEKNGFKTRKDFHFELSSILFLSASALLILALMTPISSLYKTTGANEDKTVLLCESALPEAILHVLHQLDNIIVSEKEYNVSSNTNSISVSSSRPSRYPETGNHLYIYADGEKKSDSAPISFQILATGPNREIAQLTYTNSQAKETEFPIAVANAIKHFDAGGISLRKIPRQKRETLSLWLTASAGILLLCRRICSRRHRKQ